MSNIDKQAVAGDVNAKTYYIHPAAFGSTKNPGYGHVPVVHADDFEKQRAKLEAAEKRIAELEAQEVREEGNQFLVVRHPGRSPVIKHSAGDLEGFLRQLLEHDPMATIDIITHRYYGVGGQWVQDADEYLQMMAAAAGKGE
ncbi:ead/Ea22-like family protein [Enterobacter hormaechei]|uniref:ead/Ea22-like family protein n=1 Tax=Enterobacter hormaechei TaxID=158836 RepID=UPI000B31C965